MSFSPKRDLSKGNTMNLKSLIVAAVATASIAPAFAEPEFVDVSNARSGKSRAEVLADLEIYRASGLAELESHNSVDFTSPRYEEARLIYAGLRQQPGFQRLVMAIAQQRGEAPETTAASDASVRAQ
jgi:hypothetical protein